MKIRMLKTYENIDVGPIMQNKSNCGKSNKQNAQVARPVSTLAGRCFRGHILVLWLTRFLNRLFGLGLLDRLRNFSFVLESEWDNTLEASVGVCEDNFGSEIFGDFSWHDHCQVVIVAVDVLSGHFVLNINILTLTGVLHLHIEITTAKYMNSLRSRTLSQRNPIHKPLLNFNRAQ